MVAVEGSALRGHHRKERVWVPLTSAGLAHEGHDLARG